MTATPLMVNVFEKMDTGLYERVNRPISNCPSCNNPPIAIPGEAGGCSIGCRDCGVVVGVYIDYDGASWWWESMIHDVKKEGVTR